MIHVTSFFERMSHYNCYRSESFCNLSCVTKFYKLAARDCWRTTSNHWSVCRLNEAPWPRSEHGRILKGWSFCAAVLGDVKSSRPTRSRGLNTASRPFFGLGPGHKLVVSGLGLVLGLVQRWPRSYLGWPLGLVVIHQNLLSVTEYLAASSSEYSHSCKLSDMRQCYGIDTLMTTIAIFLELNSN